MRDDFDGPDERRLHDLFSRVRAQVVSVSGHFAERVRRRVRANTAKHERPVEPMAVVGGGLIELINMLGRLFGGAADPPTPRLDAPPPAAAPPSSDIDED